MSSCPIFLMVATAAIAFAASAPGAQARYVHKTAMQCSAEYEAQRTDLMLRGESRKDFIDKCRRGNGDNAAQEGSATN